MRIISFDVGMKNLAYCLFSIPDSLGNAGGGGGGGSAASPNIPHLIRNIHIEKWDVIDLRFGPNLSESEIITAPAPIKRTCINDTKLAKWMYLSSSTNSAILYCSKCAEKSKYKTPSREILPIKRKLELLQKKKLGELMDIKANLSTSAAAEQPPTNLKLKKSDLIQEITTTLSRDFMEPFDENKYSSFIAGTLPAAKPKKANYTYAHDLDLITYGRNLMNHLDHLLYTPSASSPPLEIDMMLIENQISTLASRMKTLQGMITQYFIMKHVPQIEFISASCKLKLFTDTPLSVHPTLDADTDADADVDADADAGALCIDASTYADRKKSGIAICRSLGQISQSDYSKWMPVFEKHKKKDDLADCFLQGLWRISTRSVA